MYTQTAPDSITKLIQLSASSAYEPAGDQPQRERQVRVSRSPNLAECITQIATPRGSVPILKAMLTTACERNCYYCPFRAGRSRTKRLTISPDELADGFDRLHRAGQVQGLFLSSGIIKGGVTTQDKIIDAAEILRQRYQYRGYLHLKIMPGVETDQLRRLMQLGDRVSINLEGPTHERLRALASRKEFNRELLDAVRLSERIRRDHPHAKLANTVTQFVVGAVGDTDQELLTLSESLYLDSGLTRAYYSGFHPVDQTPFENLPATNPTREHRLYQASFLLRDYGWSAQDFFFQSDGNLSLDADPKLAWAEVHLREKPVEINRASREQLLRIPGIGPRAADTILRARRQGTLTDLSHLRHLRIYNTEHAAPFILLNGSRPAEQLQLFA